MKAGLVLLLCTLPLAGQKVHELCAPCHAEQVADFYSHTHFQKGLSCDVCHGASVKHRTSTGAVAPDRVAAPDEAPALCGACHTAQGKEYSASQHGKLVLARSKTRAANCATCHGVHNARAARAMLQQCQKCHATLPASHPALTAGSTCFGCHSKHTLAAKK
ncbi:MAG: cytochrome c3 family protein [Bryobacteraceae bacterium]